MNDVQLQYGKNLALTAAIKHGDKVLDMGCGTGELTSFLAEKVGIDGQVIGVDPDQHRIKVAIQFISAIVFMKLFNLYKGKVQVNSHTTMSNITTYISAISFFNG